MFEKSLHSANIAASVAVVATAADLTFAGGAATTIGAALSGHSLLKGLSKPEKTLAQKMAEAAQKHVSQSHLTADRRKIVAQVFKAFPPTDSDLAKGGMSLDGIQSHMRARVEGEATDPSHKTGQALADYQALLEAVLKPALEPQDANQAMLQEILRLTKESGKYQTLRDEGITEKAIIRLAQRVAEDVEDVGQAWTELQNAMEIAVRVQKEGGAPSNHGDFVDRVLARVAALAQEGDYGGAGAEIAAALAEEDAAHARRTERLLTSGIELALLDRDADRAAGLLVQRADLQAGGRIAFEALHALWIEYYERGRDKGVALDLEVSIALARLVLDRAASPDEAGNAGNDLGNALAILGERETGTDRLEQAVTAYRAALEEWTRDLVPLDWAMTQNNLGTALQTLGQRETGTDRLEQAVTAYRAALEEQTRDLVPLHWATTQNNLGIALKTLGEREVGTDRLEQAVTAYRAALEERTRDRVPLDWAATQNNLGTALNALGERETGTDRLEQAVTAYRAALEERTRDRVPLDWAATQNNLGNALSTLGERETGTDRLEQAVTAFRAALEEQTRDLVPLDWARAQNNLGTVLWTLGERESGTDRLEQAVTAYRAALEERTRDRVPLDWAATQFNLALLDLALFDKTGDPAYLATARNQALAAKDVFDEAAPHYAALVEDLLAKIDARSGKT
jgi:tetratricopeptide (TPR) repeat protein